MAGFELFILTKPVENYQRKIDGKIWIIDL